MAGTFAAIISTYTLVEGFRESLKGFRSGKSTQTNEPESTRTTTPEAEPEPENVSAIPEELPGEPTEPIVGRVGEEVDDFVIYGDKRLEGDTYQRDIYGLHNLKGKQTDIRPITRLAQSFIQEARGSGAARLRIIGHVVRNPNVLRINRLAVLMGGTSRVIGPMEIEIVIPLK
jgi:hypothetical protein